MKRPVHPLLLTLGLLVTLCATARADVVIDGTDAFRTSVQNCLNLITRTGGTVATILSDLETSGRTHLITQTATPPNTTTFQNNNAGTSVAAGGGGTGTNTTIRWGPSITTAYADGTRRDPCASLLHEMSHARDGDTGTADTRNDAATGIPNEEIRACTFENLYRQANGLPNRTQYGATRLPASAIPPPVRRDDVGLTTNASAGGLR